MKKKFYAETYKKELNTSTDINKCPKVPVPPIAEQQNYIFISYSHKDYKAVYSDLADMYEAGVRFWYDSGLSAGKMWDEEVKDKITNPNCVGVIFYMSENLFKSESATLEIELTYNSAGENLLNYFSVNLTDKAPIDILSDVLTNGERKFSMKQITILGQAFPDNSTYLHFNSPNHATELIQQIKNQFGVINDTKEKDIFDTDNSACEVVIYPPGSQLSEDFYNHELNVSEFLKEHGISSYIFQEENITKIKEELAQAFSEYATQQNLIKLKTAKALIVLTPALMWDMYAQSFGEFDPDSERLKKIIYLVHSSNEQDFFWKFNKNTIEACVDKDIKKRILFIDDYQDKLLDLLKE